jgi:hypothetical protein
MVSYRAAKGEAAIVVEGEEADVDEGEEASAPGRRESASERSMVGGGRGGGGEKVREAIVVRLHKALQLQLLYAV